MLSSLLEHPTMPTTEQDLESFARYAQQRIDEGDADLSIDELFDLWRAENPPDDTHAENVAAVAASIEDFKKGDRGTRAGRLTLELRRRSE
jgi:hypothetical protein